MIYAQVQNGLVINIQKADAQDTKDPASTWVDITSADPFPSIGWSYDGASFAPPADSRTLQERITDKKARLTADMNAYIDMSYSTNTKIMLSTLLAMAMVGSKPNQAAYIGQALTWIIGILSSTYSLQGQLDSAADIAALDALTWDFSASFDATDPHVTVKDAMQKTD